LNGGHGGLGSKFDGLLGKVHLLARLIVVLGSRVVLLSLHEISFEFRESPRVAPSKVGGARSAGHSDGAQAERRTNLLGGSTCFAVRRADRGCCLWDRSSVVSLGSELVNKNLGWLGARGRKEGLAS